MDDAIVTPFISLVLGTLGGGLANYWLRRREERARVGDSERLVGCGRLVTSLAGFIDGKPAGKKEFLAESRKAHLYASAEVLQCTSKFLEELTSKEGDPRIDTVPLNVADRLVANLLLAMRRDLGFADARVDRSLFRILRVAKSGPREKADHGA